MCIFTIQAARRIVLIQCRWAFKGVTGADQIVKLIPLFNHTGLEPFYDGIT
jgi:hypothetical protein